MVAEGAGARRLPQEIVLNDPRAGPAGELGDGAADAWVEHDPGDGAVGLPAVADLARQAGVAGALLPVDLVGPHAGLEFTAEQAAEARAQLLDGVRLDQALDHEEAVLAEARPLVPAQ